MDQEPARPKHPIEHVLDLFLYAPVGFLAEAPSLLPRFVKRGRDQVAMVRAVGMYALRRDPDELEAVINRHPHAQSAIRALGLVPAGKPSDNGSGASSGARGSQLAAVSDLHEVADRDRLSGDGGFQDREPDEPKSDSGIDPASLAIPDYESLSASQVVPRLASLTSDELEAIRLYENGNRARRTILNKIAQLQAT